MPTSRRPVERLSAAQARRVALAAQGFADPRPAGAPTGWAVRRLIDRVGLVQIDSVNVLQRAHYLPLFSRAGPVRHGAARPRRALRAAAAVRVLGPRGVAAAGRAAAGAALAHGPRGRTRRGAGCGGSSATGPSSSRRCSTEVRRARPDRGERGARGGAAEAHRPVVGLERRQARVRVAVLERAGHVGAAARLRAPLRPAGARAARRGGRGADAGRSRTPSASSCASRRARSASPPSATCATTSGSAPAEARERVAELVEAGELWPVRGRGLARARRTSIPPRGCRDACDARALVGPFDSLIWERPRVERLFGFRYRIEIYVPAPQRVHGYYVLPFLLGDRLVARVDLKADRQGGALRVQAAHAEPGAPPETAAELRAELESMAGWLGLERIDVVRRGDLAPALGATAGELALRRAA